MSQNIKTDSSFDPSTFDAYPELYDGTLNWPYRKELELPTIQKLLGNVSGLKIMDFGCGPGVITRWLHAQGASQVVGFDISEWMLEYARQCENKNPLGIQYVSVLNDEDSETFDIILAVYVIPYLPNQPDLSAMFENIFKLLKPGGRFITLPIHPEFNREPNYYLPFGFNLIEMEPKKDGSKIKLELRIPPHNVDLEAYYWSKKTLEDSLHQVGFKNIIWPKLETKPNLSPNLIPYANSPHAAIIQAQKE